MANEKKQTISNKTKITAGMGIFFLILIFVILYSMDGFNFKRKIYNDDDFGVEKYESAVDKDSDGIEDQADMLESVRNYIKKKPKYKDNYYEKGYPEDNYGINADVVAFGMLGAGYNIKQLLNEDVLAHKKAYNIKNVDIKMDFRRIKNLKVYLERNTKSLTKELGNINEWQGGDIVIIKDNDIGVVSNRRNSRGVPYVIHLYSPNQTEYEEDILEKNKDNIVGHFRIS